ncbi:MAG TPA: aminotransferase class IV [Bacteroidota bacterium]|nr:aminotransferase class IV [Bacteroidota bacterium]
MSLLLETIKVRGRKYYHLEEHARRMNRSRRELFGAEHPIPLGEVLRMPDDLDDRLCKCRVIYDREIRKVEYQPYVFRTCRSLRYVRADNLVYDHKYADRSAIDRLLKEAGTDDIVLLREGKVTDASYANLIFSDGKDWYTPREPLLAGIRRGLLLRSGAIREADITPEAVKRFSSVMLINALLPIEAERSLPVTAILDE